MSGCGCAQCELWSSSRVLDAPYLTPRAEDDDWEYGGAERA